MSQSIFFLVENQVIINNSLIELINL